MITLLPPELQSGLFKAVPVLEGIELGDDVVALFQQPVWPSAFQLESYNGGIERIVSSDEPVMTTFALVRESTDEVVTGFKNQIDKLQARAYELQMELDTAREDAAKVTKAHEETLKTLHSKKCDLGETERKRQELFRERTELRKKLKETDGLRQELDDAYCDHSEAMRNLGAAHNEISKLRRELDRAKTYFGEEQWAEMDENSNQEVT